MHCRGLIEHKKVIGGFHVKQVSLILLSRKWKIK